MVLHSSEYVLKVWVDWLGADMANLNDRILNDSSLSSGLGGVLTSWH
jgi:hypothetical protein